MAARSAMSSMSACVDTVCEDWGGGGVKEGAVSHLVVSQGAVLGDAWDEGGHSENVVDQRLHEFKETVSGSNVQRRSENQIGDLEVQLSLKQRCGTWPLIWMKEKEDFDVAANETNEI